MIHVYEVSSKACKKNVKKEGAYEFLMIDRGCRRDGRELVGVFKLTNGIPL